jgi:tetratricopeptide (TPR) repeat protein
MAICAPAMGSGAMTSPPTCQQARLMAATLHEQGRWPEALSTAKTALDRANLVFGCKSLQAAKSHVLVGELYASRGKRMSADMHYSRAISIIQKTSGNEVPGLVRPLVALAAISHADKAEHLFKKALLIDRDAEGPGGPASVHALLGLASLCQRDGRTNESLNYLGKALAIHSAYSKYDPSLDKMAVSALCSLGDMHSKDSRYAQAASYYRRAAEILESKTPANLALLELIFARLGDCCRISGSVTEARMAHQRANALRVRTSLTSLLANTDTRRGR